MIPSGAPALSIIVSNYHNSSGVKRLLEETPSELRDLVEYVIVDDHSGVECKEVILEAVGDYPNAKVTFHEKNKGVLATQKTGVAIATGTYLCFRGSDDRNLEQFWEVVRSHLVNQTAELICGDISKVIANTSEQIHISNEWTNQGEERFYTPEQFAAVCGEKQIWGQAVFVKSDVFKEFGGFSPDLAWASDLILFQAIAFTKGVLSIARPLVQVEIDRTSFSARGMALSPQNESIHIAIIKEVLKQDEPTLSRFASSGWLGRFGPAIALSYQKRPELWSSKAREILDRNFYYLNRERDLSKNRCYDQAPISLALTSLSKTIRANNSSTTMIALYGAGEIARKIVLSWSDHELPPLRKIITSDAPPPQKELLGIPIASACDENLCDYDYIIIASKVFQNQIRSICLKHLDPSKIVTIYNDQ